MRRKRGGMSDTLLVEAEERRRMTLEALDPEEQARRGQYFTPARAAEIMAALPRDPSTVEVRILDPGAGTGMLSVALVHRLLADCPGTRLHITAVEDDPALGAALVATLRELEGLGDVSTELVDENFLVWADTTSERFDFVIQNPPYAKLSANSVDQRRLRASGVYVPNIYAAFLTLGGQLLKPGGQQVAITPRSWMNGTYYARFRRAFLEDVGIDAIHTFESRSKVFGDTGVLQESIIVSATKGQHPDTVEVSTSTDHIGEIVTRTVPYEQIVTPDFVHVPATAADAEAVAWMQAHAQCTLEDLGLAVSTGRVVDFRSRDAIVAAHEPGAVPLIHASHVRQQGVGHPIKPRKPEWFVPRDAQDRKMLVPGGAAYVLVKRFSAKEERRRIVAGVWESEAEAAFDNKVNFIHQDGQGIDSAVARGLTAYLNTSRVDAYFRVFSGHTQVNATDLRQMRFPSRSALRALAAATSPQGDLDAALDAVLDAKGVAA